MTRLARTKKGSGRRTLAFGLALAMGCMVGIPGMFGCGPEEELSSASPDIPVDFPQLDSLEPARIDVVVDGEGYEGRGFCSHGPTVDATGIRFSLNIGFFAVSVTGRGIERYSSAADQVTASWAGVETYESSSKCGESVVWFEGEEPFDGIRGDEVATWGTLQLVLCDGSGDRLEVSGKFSCALL